jgi:hypothetical protein
MVQLLPSDDDFAAGSPSYGSFATLYLGCVASTSSVTFWNPNSAFIARPIHGAYQTIDSDGKHDYNAAFHSSGTTTRAPSGCIFRRPFAADCLVTGIFEMRSLAGGAPGIADLAPRGVLARVSAGTLAGDGTADVRFTNADGYMAALYQKTSDSTLRFAVYRWNAGVATLVGAESVALPTTTTAWTALATITLSVSGSGATVTLAATLKGLGSNITLTLNRTDSDASRITAAGRAGFLMGSDRVVSGKTTVDLCHLLAVDESGVRKLQDEFLRLSLAGAKQTAADGAATPGSGYLSSAFFWDAATFDGTDVESGLTFAGSKRLAAGSGAVSFDNQITDDNGPTSRVAAGRLILSQRPSDNLFSQHRSVSVTLPASSIPTASTGEVWAGLALRATQAKPRDQTGGAPSQTINNNPHVPGGTAYVLAVRAKTSTQVIWQLHRIKNNSHTAVARKTENSPFIGAFPGYGVAFTVELDVHPRDEADPFGVVQIVCTVNGTALALTEYPGGVLPAGVTNPDAGVFQDSGTSRITSGFGEGLFVCNGLTSTGTDVNNYDPAFDNWTQGSLTNAAVLDVDQPSIAVAGEADALVSSPAFPLIPDIPMEVEYASHGLSIPFESGHRQTAPRFLDDADALVRRRVYRFGSTVREADVDDLMAHWNATDGVELPFSWTPPNDSAVTVHYAREPVRTMLAGGVFRVECELEELK